MLKKLSIGVLAVLLAVVVVTAGLVGYVLHDPRLVKARLERTVEDATGRTFTIAGGLDIDPGPITVIGAEGVALANAAWAQSPELVSVARLQVRVDVWRTLADGRIVLPEVRLERPSSGRDSVADPDGTEAVSDLFIVGTPSENGITARMASVAHDSASKRFFRALGRAVAGIGGTPFDGGHMKSLISA